MKILVVEDEIKTGDYLKQGLVEAGFIVDLARDGLDGLHLALTDAYDLAILDVMLPGIVGWRGGRSRPPAPTWRWRSSWPTWPRRTWSWHGRADG